MKSNVSDYLEVLQCVYKDACSKCVADVSDLRDVLTITSRVRDEGLSFLTITLPQFCKDFERCLALGYIDSTCFANFGKHGSVPNFLKGMISLIFNRENGRIYDENSQHWSDFPTIIESVRQICLTFKKLEVECTPKRVSSALQKFVETEQSFESFPVPDDVENFDVVTSILYGSSMGDLRLHDLSPRHGPGQTADRISGNAKYAWRRWHERLDPYFPFIDMCYTYSAYDSEEIEKVTFISEAEEQPVKVVSVPKTLKGPRIIAVEPVCMQYAQQALKTAIVAALENSYWTSGHINFRDQGTNQELALDSSRTGRLATIDLSDASDRVPLSLAISMFKSHPDLQDAILACRSTRAKMPSGFVLEPLRKFASMGSALCFPIEAMYFYAICVMALVRSQNLPITRENVYVCSRDVYVYGDDILVPTLHATSVLDYLQKYNCKVNTAKTFFSGNFRESCGTDAFLGYEVTPTYIKKVQPKNRQQAPELISWVKTANAFYQKGYWSASSHMMKVCERILGTLPYVSPSCSGLGRVSFLGYRSVERWNRDLQRFEVKTWIPRPVYRSDMIDGYAALTKSLHTVSPLSFKDNREFSEALHLERSALHHAVAIQRGWVPAT